jgi:hypothetical protein
VSRVRRLAGADVVKFAGNRFAGKRPSARSSVACSDAGSTGVDADDGGSSFVILGGRVNELRSACLGLCQRGMPTWLRAFEPGAAPSTA